MNPHAFWAPPPQDGVSANFTTSARVGIHREYNKFYCALRGWSGRLVSLKMLCEGRESVELDEPLRGQGLRQIVVFEHPGVGVVHVDSVQSCSERGVDIGTGTVADHPRGLVREIIPRDYLPIGIGVFFRWDLDRGEVHVYAGAI